MPSSGRYLMSIMLAVGFMSGTRQARNSNHNYDFTVCCARKTYFGVICSFNEARHLGNGARYVVSSALCREGNKQITGMAFIKPLNKRESFLYNCVALE